MKSTTKVQINVIVNLILFYSKENACKELSATLKHKISIKTKINVSAKKALPNSLQIRNAFEFLNASKTKLW